MASNTVIEVTSPLFYTHQKVAILTWRRSMEIALASKRKLGFTGLVKRDATDLIKQMLGTHLEQRYTVANGSRKYLLNKAVYEMKQQGRSITEYYTELRGLWEEIESLSDYPPITNEESQRQNLKPIKEESDGMAMYSQGIRRGKGSYVECTACGKIGHIREECWTIKGFPPGHPKAKEQGDMKGKGKEYESTGSRGGRGGRQGRGGGRYAGNIQSDSEPSSKQGESTSQKGGITLEQIEQALKNIASTKASASETGDELKEHMQAWW
ncbi:Replication protein A 70 kDa DNA-binding subunit E [Bienertia sinuspersici]